MSNNKLPSYGKVQHAGTRHVANILDGPYFVQEKIDGSQMTVGVIDGELFCRSKGAVLDLDCTNKQFKDAVEHFKALHKQGRLLEGAVYRGECVSKPKHNVLCYDRVPDGCFVLFDAQLPTGEYARPDELARVADLLGVSFAPCFATPELPSTAADVRTLASGPSFLGGPREGIVIKRYDVEDPTQPGTPLKAKVVDAEFKERMTGKKSRTGDPDPVLALGASYAVEARFRKAVQHLRDEDKLEGEPRDIAPLMRELNRDLEEECGEEIKDELFKIFRKKILRESSNGFPQWYKNELMKEGGL